VIHPSFSSTICVRGGIDISSPFSEADWTPFTERLDRKASTIFDLSCSATFICKVTGQLLKVITGKHGGQDPSRRQRNSMKALTTSEKTKIKARVPHPTQALGSDIQFCHESQGLGHM
jgi:hypothetical protein